MDITTKLEDVSKVKLVLRPSENSCYGVGVTIGKENDHFTHEFAFLHAADSNPMTASVYEAKTFTVLTQIATIPYDVMWLAGIYHRRLLGLFDRDNLTIEDLLFNQQYVKSEVLTITKVDAK